MRSPHDRLADLIDSDVPDKYQPVFERFLDRTNDDAKLTAVADLVRAGNIDAALRAIGDDRLLKLAAVLALGIKSVWVSTIKTLRSSTVLAEVELSIKRTNSIEPALAILDSHMTDLVPAIKDAYVKAGTELAEDNRVALKGLKPSAPVSFNQIATQAQAADGSTTSAVYSVQAAHEATIVAEVKVKAAQDVTAAAVRNAEAATKAAERAMRSIKQAQASSAIIRTITGDTTDAIAAAAKKAIKATQDAVAAADRAAVSASTSPAEAVTEALKAADDAKAAAQVVTDAKNATQAIDDAVRELRPSVGISFDPTNPRAAAEADAMAYDLIRQVTDEQRQAVRVALTEALINGESPKKAAAAFRDSIGLTETQQRAVQNYRDALESGSKSALDRALRDKRSDRRVARAGDDPLSADQIDKMVDRYRENYIAYRADTIALTESTAATGAANHESMRQTLEAVDIDPDTGIEKTWNGTMDMRIRPSHRAMNEQKVIGMNTMFVSGLSNRLLYPGYQAAPAEDRVRCRCVCTYRILSIP